MPAVLLSGMYLLTEQSRITTIHAIRREVTYNVKMKLNVAGARVSQKRKPAARTQYRTWPTYYHGESCDDYLQ